MKYQLWLVELTLCLPINLMAQSDSIPKQSSFSGFPAISSSPESGLQFGGVLLHSFNLSKDNPFNRQSQVKYLAFYTTKQQILTQVEGQLFTKDSKYNIYGKIDYNRWTDRLYKRGNNADALVLEYTDDKVDSLNYMNFGVNYFEIQTDFMRKINNNLFAGVALNYVSSTNFEALVDSVVDVNDDLEIDNALGQQVGFGFKISYDNRKFLSNPLNSSFVQLAFLNYSKILGADYSYNFIQLDARKYFNFIKNQTLALRLLADQRIVPSGEPLPYYGAAKIGNGDFMRGYFQSTFFDNNSLGAEVEYRIPFWKENTEAPIWKIWNRLGMAVFASAGKTYTDWATFGNTDFHATAGLGLRILVDPEQRTALRVDYGLGLTDNADGLNGRQTGLYISINEAF